MQELQADIIITATGLNLQLFGGAEIRRNGEPVELNDTMAYKGMMLTGMPNMAFTIGYTNASWTLKADLVSEFVCRVINYMDENGYDTVVPQHPGDSVDERPLMDFTPGYVLRALDYLPKAGFGFAVAAQAELLHGPAADPARQGRRRGSAVRQKACGAGGLARLGARVGRSDDDDAVVVAVGDVARHELHSAEADRERRARRRRSCSLLRGLVPSALMPMSMSRSAAASRTAPCTISPAQPLDRASSAMRSPTSAVCSEAPPSITSTPPCAGRRQHRLQQRVVLRAAHRADRPGELCSRAELAELDVAAADVGPDVVDQIGRRPEYHSHRAMLVIVAAELANQQHRQQADRDRHRQRYRRPAC